MANTIHAQNVTGNTSPVTQVIDFVAAQTNDSKSDVKDSIKTKLANVNGIGGHINELNTNAADHRADLIDVTIDTPTGGGNRTTLITALGKLGYFEEQLRGGGGPDFDGGHLVALSHWNNWGDINSAKNVVPQDRGDNRYGTWRDEERAVSNSATLINPYRFKSTATYPDTNYTVKLDDISTAMLQGSVAGNVTNLNKNNTTNINTRKPAAVTHTLTTPNSW